MSRDDYAFPCAGCLCDHCANNLYSSDQMTGEAKIFCYSEDAHTYCMVAWRSPEVEKLWKILRETKWDCKDKEFESHEEKYILHYCISLMQELVGCFEEWYRWVHGENAIEELSEEERLPYSR